MLKSSSLRVKRTAMTSVMEYVDELDKPEDISEVTTQTTLDEEEFKTLRNMKLFLVVNSRFTTVKRRTWQRWTKFMKSRDDLMTVSQVTMFKTLQRVMYKHEISCLSKRFYHWKYFNTPEEKCDVESQEIQTDNIEFKREFEVNEQDIQTENEQVEKQDAE